jgi:superfamily I DNA/RNA helicase
MSTKDRIARGFKRLSGLDEDSFYTFKELVEDHGLLATNEMIWHEAMDKMPERDRAYIVAMLRRGEKFNGIPRINVSTIHGSKGGEADNVCIFTDLSPAADESMRIDADDVHRTFYVGVTRTKENLFIVEPEDISRSYDL